MTRITVFFLALALCSQFFSGDAFAQKARKKKKAVVTEGAAVPEAAEASSAADKSAKKNSPSAAATPAAAQATEADFTVTENYGAMTAVVKKHLEGDNFDISAFVRDSQKALFEKNRAASVLLSVRCALDGASGERIAYNFFERYAGPMTVRSSNIPKKSALPLIAKYIPELQNIAGANAYESEYMGLKGYQIMGGTGENRIDAVCYQVSTNSVLIGSASMKTGRRRAKDGKVAGPRIIAEPTVYRSAIDSARNWRDNAEYSFINVSGLKNFRISDEFFGANSVATLGIEGAAAQVRIYSFGDAAAAEKALKKIQDEGNAACYQKDDSVITIPQVMKK